MIVQGRPSITQDGQGQAGKVQDSPGSGARVDLFFAVRLRDRSIPCPDFAVQVTARLQNRANLVWAGQTGLGGFGGFKVLKLIRETQYLQQNFTFTPQVARKVRQSMRNLQEQLTP